MEQYSVIEIETKEVVYSSSEYILCIKWIEDNGDIINYTIIKNI